MMNRIVCLMFRNTQGAVLPGDAPDEFLSVPPMGGSLSCGLPAPVIWARLPRHLTVCRGTALRGC